MAIQTFRSRYSLRVLFITAYRHVLTVLQELDPDTMPFKPQLIDLDDNIDRPGYLEKHVGLYDLGVAKPFEDMKEILGYSRVSSRHIRNVPDYGKEN